MDNAKLFYLKKLVENFDNSLPENRMSPETFKKLLVKRGWQYSEKALRMFLTENMVAEPTQYQKAKGLDNWLDAKMIDSQLKKWGMELAQEILEAFVNGEIIYDYVPREDSQPSMRFSIEGSHDPLRTYRDF